MSKHFHSVKNAKKMLQHGSREIIGPFCKPWPDKKARTSNSQALGNLGPVADKKSRPSATNTETARVDPTLYKTSESTPILGADEGDCQV